jgi:hypothetical protein
MAKAEFSPFLPDQMESQMVLHGSISQRRLSARRRRDLPLLRSRSRVAISAIRYISPLTSMPIMACGWSIHPVKKFSPAPANTPTSMQLQFSSRWEVIILPASRTIFGWI